MSDDQTAPERLQDFLSSIAAALDQILNGKEVLKDKTLRKTGFILMIYPYGSIDDRCNFITNGATRTEIIARLKTQIQTFEDQIAKEKPQ